MLLVHGPHVEKQKARGQRASKGVFLLLAGALDPNSGEVAFAVERTCFSNRRLASTEASDFLIWLSVEDTSFQAGEGSGPCPTLMATSKEGISKRG